MADWGPDVLKTWPPEKAEHAPPFVIVNQWNPAWPIGFATGYSFDESESTDLCVKYVQESQLAAHRLALAALVEAGEKLSATIDRYMVFARSEGFAPEEPGDQFTFDIAHDYAAMSAALAEGKKVLNDD